MNNKPQVATGVVHEVPDDMHQVIVANANLLEVWNGLTPLARNEWICWTTIVKQEETRKEHIERMQEDLLKNGKRRPCCWPGCPHHNKNARKYFKNLDL